jgi:PiT family inorganic phosphate transporter
MAHPSAEHPAPDQNTAPGQRKWLGLGLFGILLATGLGYTVSHFLGDLAGAPSIAVLAYLLLGVALLIALGFEFVNGFHDTANAVATVIYTNSLRPPVAVVWSGLWNFAGVLTSSGAVAFGIISLLPVELILQVGSSAGFAMVFALLIAAIIWNLGTWYLGLPSSSSHTLIGSIIGVGLMNQLMGRAGATSGVDWSQALGIGKSLLFSPLIGFFAAAILLWLAKALIKVPALYRAPKGNQPPPFWIRALLILTCTGVSFAHGSNDGQKGMGLIMLILIGTVPTVYALNHAAPAAQEAHFAQYSRDASAVFDKQSAQSSGAAASAVPAGADPRPAVSAFMRDAQNAPVPNAALSALIQQIAQHVAAYGEVNKVPGDAAGNIRNDMYLVGEELRLIDRYHRLGLVKADSDALKAYHGALDASTKFIPTWVKVAVAIALGLGTMVGWKRIVVTVGEKIGKDHLNYGQGACAELVAMATIGAADAFGLPVSTTHVLSSGVAGTMAANGSGLQMETIRNMVMAWVLTLPVSIMLSGVLFWIFRHLF